MVILDDSGLEIYQADECFFGWCGLIHETSSLLQTSLSVEHDSGIGWGTTVFI